MKPVVHCITNNVTKNDCANAVLAVGASPIMAHHIEEVEEVQAFSSGLLLNLGTPGDFEAMKKALAAAGKNGHPVVLDPVGVSGISFRRKLAFELISEGGITCIRGNYKEILAIAENRNTAAGLDADNSDIYICNSDINSEKEKDGFGNKTVSDSALAALMEAYAGKTGIIIAASGATDIVTNGEKTVYINAGHSMMSRVTGMGCMASAVLASVLAAEGSRNNYFDAVCAAMELYGKCGERAAVKTESEGAGTGTFRQYFMDELSLRKFI